MNQRDFVFLTLPRLMEIKENPWYSSADVERDRRIRKAFAFTQIHFLIDTGLLREDSPVLQIPLDQAVVRFSDLTEEGQEFLVSQALDKWLGACDRKSNDMLKRETSEEERLAVYADPTGLYKRLAKFRKERKTRAN